MDDSQLSKLSYQELLESQKKIGTAIVQRRKEERAAVKAKLAALAESSGFEIDELMNNTRKRLKVAVK